MDKIPANIQFAIVITFAAGVLVFMRFWPRLQARMMGIPFINAQNVKRLLDAGENILVLDVRTQAEFTGELGHIEGSLNLDTAALDAKLDTLGAELDAYKDEPILIACHTHNRSPKAARVLYRRGFKKLMILDYGMSGWNRAGYPVVHGA